MLLLVPVEIIDSGDFLFNLLSDEENIFFRKTFGNRFIFFFENSHIFLVIKSKDK